MMDGDGWDSLDELCDRQRERDHLQSELGQAQAIINDLRSDLRHARAQLVAMLALLVLSMLGWWLS